MNRSSRQTFERRRRPSRDEMAMRARSAMAEGNWPLAIRMLRKVISSNPTDAEALGNLGAAYLQTGDTEKAEEVLDNALKLAPDTAEVLGNVANLKKQMGDMSGAEAYYRRLLEQMPGSTRAWQELSLVKRFRITDPDIQTIENLLKSRHLDADGKMYAGFALAKAYEDISEYDMAFAHLDEANRIKRASLSFNISAFETGLDAITDAFNEEFISRNMGGGHPDPRPVFILGMPRSGTSLVEQILASHSKIHGAGELEELREVIIGAMPGFPAGVDELVPKTLSNLGRKYANSLRNWDRRAARITDKMPRNFFFLGLIALILPRAKIVHCQRSPMDTCFSCFSQYFPTAQEFSYDLKELGRYYQIYQRLMDHWHRVLPGRILDVRYEDVVSEPEQMARTLIGHCELEWEDGCLDFHKTKRRVATASAAQVREPVHQRSVERWRHFEKHLEPLRVALGSVADA